MAKINNTGKKYIKLKGNEIATPANEARAQEFLAWYGKNVDSVRAKLKVGMLYDDEVATDTMLSVYTNIALKGAALKNYLGYFLQAYHTNYLASLKRVAAARNTLSLSTTLLYAPDDCEPVASTNLDVDKTPMIEKLAAPEHDYLAYELAVDEIKTTILQYVREAYDPATASLFEIYIGLQPEVSARSLAAMLGLKYPYVWQTLVGIRRDIVARFKTYKDDLLSYI